MADQTSLVNRIYGYLRGKAQMRATVTYSQVQNDLGIKRPYGGITPLLDRCAEMSLADKGVILPSLVVNKDTGMPGGKFGSGNARSGFWKFCEDHDVDIDDNPYEFLVRQQVKVFKAYSS